MKCTVVIWSRFAFIAYTDAADQLCVTYLIAYILAGCVGMILLCTCLVIFCGCIGLYRYGLRRGESKRTADRAKGAGNAAKEVGTCNGGRKDFANEREASNDAREASNDAREAGDQIDGPPAYQTIEKEMDADYETHSLPNPSEEHSDTRADQVSSTASTSTPASETVEIVTTRV